MITRASKILVVFFCIFISCTAQMSHQDEDDIGRIETFYKIVAHFRANEIDSAKHYIIDKGNSNTARYDFTMNSAMELISMSNKGLLVKDSVSLVDSSNISGEMVYTYKMNFYDSMGKYIGIVEMPFVYGNSHMPLTLYVRRIIKPIQLEIDN